ncbi:MAG TPA: hypothetical protein VIK52_00565 [Opitutaceae bacterium]
MAPPTELSLIAARLEGIGAPYMITGATAAIVYGQPRVTNDLDVVLALDEGYRAALIRAFPETDFYVPSESTNAKEQARPRKGHFNIIHHKSGYKADIYLVGDAPVHAWAMSLLRQIEWTTGLTVSVAPPEYVVLRKFEFYREGRLFETPRGHPSDKVDHRSRRFAPATVDLPSRSE